jgi:putative transposase
MRYQFIKKQQEHHAIELLCDVMEVSRSGYYAYVSRPESRRETEDRRLQIKVIAAFKDSRSTYGYRRITNELNEQQESCGKHRVISLMRKLDLRAKARRKFKATTNSQHDKPVYENQLNRQFNPAKINQAWVSDITYVATKEGWLYLAAIMDLYSRNIIGWCMDRRMTDELVINALKMALFKRKIASGLLLHPDRVLTLESSIFKNKILPLHSKCNFL